jgi:hypothetical protein
MQVGATGVGRVGCAHQIFKQKQKEVYFHEEQKVFGFCGSSKPIHAIHGNGGG